MMTVMKNRRRAMNANGFARWVSVTTLALIGSGAAAEEIIQLPTRGSAVQPYLLSQEGGKSYSAVALLFPGGEGVASLLDKGIPQPGSNFVTRTRSLLLARGIATALVDSPSDMHGMTDPHRSGRNHVIDVSAVVDDVKKRFPGAKVFLMGTSRGTVSAAYTGAALGDRIDGVVLTSSLFRASRTGSGLSGFDYASIKKPLLFVHHRDDACAQTPYAEAKRLSDKYPLVTVSGGDAALSPPCEPFAAHGYLGREEPVINAIAGWILGQPYSKDIQ
jgi:hypothetical protein